MSTPAHHRPKCCNVYRVDAGDASGANDRDRRHNPAGSGGEGGSHRTGEPRHKP